MTPLALSASIHSACPGHRLLQVRQELPMGAETCLCREGFVYTLDLVRARLDIGGHLPRPCLDNMAGLDMKDTRRGNVR